MTDATTTTDMDKELVKRLMRLYAEIPYASNIEAMWRIRGKGIYAGVPQGLYKVGDKFASIVYMEDVDCWEAQINGGRKRQFRTFEEAKDWLKVEPSTLTA